MRIAFAIFCFFISSFAILSEASAANCEQLSYWVQNVADGMNSDCVGKPYDDWCRGQLALFIKYQRARMNKCGLSKQIALGTINDAKRMVQEDRPSNPSQSDQVIGRDAAGTLLCQNATGIYACGN